MERTKGGFRTAMAMVVLGGLGGVATSFISHEAYPPRKEVVVVRDAEACEETLEQERILAIASALVYQAAVNAYVLLAEEAMRSPEQSPDTKSRIYASSEVVLLMDKHSACAFMPEETVATCLMEDPTTLVFTWSPTDDGIHLSYQYDLATLLGEADDATTSLVDPQGTSSAEFY